VLPVPTTAIDALALLAQSLLRPTDFGDDVPVNANRHGLRMRPKLAGVDALRRQDEVIGVDAELHAAVMVNDVALGDLAKRLAVGDPVSEITTTAPDVTAAIAVVPHRTFPKNAFAHLTRGGRTTLMKSDLYPSLRLDGGSEPKLHQSDESQLPALMQSVTWPS
jgi:hypothetical protein